MREPFYKKMLYGSGRGLYLACLPGLFLLNKINSKERTRGVINNRNEILLVRNWFGRQQWTLPGGGKQGGETDEQTLQREIREETGIIISGGDFRRLGTVIYHELISPLVFTCYYKKITEAKEVKSISPELIDARWYPLKNLPQNMSQVVNVSLKIL